MTGRKRSGDNDNIYRELFRCNICGAGADFVVQLELMKGMSNYNIIESTSQIPFFLCNEHQYLYNRMRHNIELKEYFTETIIQNQ